MNRKLITLTTYLFLILIAMDSIAQSWYSPVLVDNGIGTVGNTGQYTCIIIVNRNPAMTYYDPTHQSLIYVRATNATGTAWGTPVSVDVSGNVGTFTSLQIV